MKVAVIGGGPSGLVTLKYLTEAQHSLGCEAIEARLFEYQRGVGGAFLTRTYEDAEVCLFRFGLQTHRGEGGGREGLSMTGDGG